MLFKKLLLLASLLVFAFPTMSIAQDLGDDDSAAPAAAAGDEAAAADSGEEDVVAAFQAVVSAAQALKGLKGKPLAAGVMALLTAIFTLLRIVARKWGKWVFKKELALDIITVVLSVGAAAFPIVGGAIDGSVDWASAVMLLLSGPISMVIDKVRENKKA